MKKDALFLFLIASSIVAVLACGGSGGGNGDDDQDDEVAEAPLDNDSLIAPAVDVFLSITGTRDFAYTDEVSSPDGDTEDFVGFEFPNNATPDQPIRLTLDCAITGDDDADARGVVFEDGVETAIAVNCNEGEQLRVVDNTKVQVVRIAFTEDGDGAHVDYTLTVVAF